MEDGKKYAGCSKGVMLDNDDIEEKTVIVVHFIMFDCFLIEVIMVNS